MKLGKNAILAKGWEKIYHVFGIVGVGRWSYVRIFN